MTIMPKFQCYLWTFLNFLIFLNLAKSRTLMTSFVFQVTGRDFHCLKICLWCTLNTLSFITPVTWNSLVSTHIWRGQAKTPRAAHYHFSFSSATKDVCLLQPYPIVNGPPDSVVVERVCSEPPEVGQNVGGRTDGASLPWRQNWSHHAESKSSHLHVCFTYS